MKPIKLKNLTIDTPIALGPMAGVTDLPFRLLCKEQGCGLFITEMVSAKALYYHNQNTGELLETYPEEHPIGVQLFGSDPDIIAEEALKLEDRFDFIDLNFGCPVPKIVKNGEGSFLLTQPELAGKIFKKLVQTVHIPVTVKMRKGFTPDYQEGIRIAKIAEDSGISMISVHGRSRDQFYSGKADYEAIRQIKAAVSIPVIGNGDILTGKDAERMLNETGVDGIMIGRGAEGNPWIFREIKAYLEGKEVPGRPSYEEITDMILRHARLLIAYKGEHIGALEMRKHAAWYLQGQKKATQMRRLLNEVDSYEELEKLLREVQ